MLELNFIMILIGIPDLITSLICFVVEVCRVGAVAVVVVASFSAMDEEQGEDFFVRFTFHVAIIL